MVETAVIERLRASRANDRQEAFVHELDMPPMAYFDIPTGVKSNGMDIIVRVVAHEMVFGPCSQAEANKFCTEATAEVHHALRELGGGIIWWRVRFEIDNKHSVCQAYGRCGTSPTLPDSFWAQLDHRTAK